MTELGREERVSVGRSTSHCLLHLKQSRYTPQLEIIQKKKSSPSVLPLAVLSLARSFSRAGEIAETACPPRHPVRLRDKHFLELGNKIVNFAVLNMLVLRVKRISRAEEEEDGLFLSAEWGSVAHYTGLLSYNGCSLQGR